MVAAFITPVREAAAGGHWATLNGEEEGSGVHIFISGSGRVEKGPQSLIGGHIGHLASHPSVKSAEHHPPGHEPPGARSHPQYTEHQPPEKPAPLPGKPYARLSGAPQTRQEQPKEGPEPLSKEQTHAGLQTAREQAKAAKAATPAESHEDKTARLKGEIQHHVAEEDRKLASGRYEKADWHKAQYEQARKDLEAHLMARHMEKPRAGATWAASKAEDAQRRQQAAAEQFAKAKAQPPAQPPPLTPEQQRTVNRTRDEAFAKLRAEDKATPEAPKPALVSPTAPPSGRERLEQQIRAHHETEQRLKPGTGLRMGAGPWRDAHEAKTDALITYEQRYGKEAHDRLVDGLKGRQTQGAPPETKAPQEQAADTAVAHQQAQADLAGPTTHRPQSTSTGLTATKADLSVARGQGEPAQSKIDAVARWANAVPEHYKALLRDAGHTLTHHNVSSDQVHPGLKANARFHEPSRTIESFREGTEHNVLHEMGHAVDRSLGARLGQETPVDQIPKLGATGAKRTDRSMQPDFLALFKKYRDAGTISGNAATAPHELFAEAFALRHNPTLKGYLERRMPELAGFFDRLDHEARSPGATASSTDGAPEAKAADAAVAHQQAQADLAAYRASKDRNPNPWAPHLSPPVNDAKDRELQEKATRAQLAHQSVQAQQQQAAAAQQQEGQRAHDKEMVRLKADVAPKPAITPLPAKPPAGKPTVGEITKEHIQAKVMAGEHLTREEKGFVLNGYRMPKPKSEAPSAPQKAAEQPKAEAKPALGAPTAKAEEKPATPQRDAEGKLPREHWLSGDVEHADLARHVQQSGATSFKDILNAIDSGGAQQQIPIKARTAAYGIAHAIGTGRIGGALAKHIEQMPAHDLTGLVTDMANKGVSMNDAARHLHATLGEQAEQAATAERDRSRAQAGKDVEQVRQRETTQKAERDKTEAERVARLKASTAERAYRPEKTATPPPMAESPPAHHMTADDYVTHMHATQREWLQRMVQTPPPGQDGTWFTRQLAEHGTTPTPEYRKTMKRSHYAAVKRAIEEGRAVPDHALAAHATLRRLYGEHEGTRAHRRRLTGVRESAGHAPRFVAPVAAAAR